MKRKAPTDEEDIKIAMFSAMYETLNERSGTPAGKMVYEFNDSLFVGDKCVRNADNEEMEECYSKEEEEDGSEDEEEPPSEIVTSAPTRMELISEIMSSLKEADRSERKYLEPHDYIDDPDELLIEVGDSRVLLQDTSWNVSSLLPTLEKVCEPAKFGDMKTNTTRQDETVRKALSTKDFKAFVPDKSFCSKGVPLEEWLAKHATRAECFMRVKNISVRPHALNVYQEGCHFDWHLDTQRTPDMIGTFTVILGNFEGGALDVRASSSTSKSWAYNEGSGIEIVGMLASCPHRVTPVTKGVRMSITFDVCGTLDSNVKNYHEKTIEFAHQLLAVDASLPAVGFVLEHMYSADDISSGSYRNPRDYSLVNSAGENGQCVQLFWGRYIQKNYEESSELMESTIFSLSEENKKFKDALVFSGKNDPERCGETLISIQADAGFTGNEACEGHDDSVYRLTILMVSRKEKEAN